MKLPLVILMSAIILVGAQDYKTLETIDLVAYANNNAILEANFKCLIDAGPCSADDAALKKLLPDVVKTQCGGCSTKVKAELDAIAIKLIKEHPDWLEQLSKVFDPTGEARREFEERQQQQ